MIIINKKNKEISSLEINFQSFDIKRKSYFYFIKPAYKFIYLNRNQEKNTLNNKNEIFLQLKKYKDCLKSFLVDKTLMSKEAYLTFNSKLNFFPKSTLFVLMILTTYKNYTENLILDSKIIEKMNYKSIFFSKKILMNLTFMMMLKLFKKYKISLKVVKNSKNICPSEVYKNDIHDGKSKIKACQLENILKKQNLRFIKKLEDVKLPIISTYMAKGNGGNFFFFIVSFHKRISTQQIFKKINKKKKDLIKMDKYSLILEGKFFSPLLLKIFKKRDLRYSWLVFDSQLLNKNILIPSLTKNIYVELKSSSFINFLSDYVYYVSCMNFPNSIPKMKYGIQNSKIL